MEFISGSLILAAAKMPTDMILQKMSEGMIETVKIFFLTLIFAIPLGVLVALGRMSKNIIIRTVFKLYISIMRGTPLMLQLLVVYFGPNFIFGMRLEPYYRFMAIIIAFSLNYAAYFAEIYRSGVEAIPVGQYEAANLLGYGKFQTFFKIICPQVVKIIMPSVTNEVICLVKDTSLAYAIAYMEMFSIGKQIAASQTSMVPYIVAAVFYYVFNLIVAGVMGFIEKKLDYYR